MKTVDREYIARQLKDLSEWADFLHLSVTMDQPFERGKVRLLESLLPTTELTELRTELRRVHYRLTTLSANLSVTPDIENSKCVGETPSTLNALRPPETTSQGETP